jgi:hypothetical protein
VVEVVEVFDATTHHPMPPPLVAAQERNRE